MPARSTCSRASLARGRCSRCADPRRTRRPPEVTVLSQVRSSVDAAIRALFTPAPGIAYLDSATYGLPPEPTVRAIRVALEAWQAGTADWIVDWDRPAEAARSSFANLIGVATDAVSLMPAVSVAVGLIAAELGPEDEIVVPADEFTSVLFPLLLARERGAVVREVALERLPDEIRPSTTLVATSLVQMQTGRMADLGAILDRAAAVGARVLVDATQAIPFVSDRVRHRSGRLHRRGRLQAPAVSAWRRLPRHSAGPPERPAADRRELARGRRSVRTLLRGPTDACPRRASARRFVGLVPVDRRGRVAPAPRVVGADRCLR